MKTNSGFLIGCDVDSVIADLHAVWLSRYNADYNDTLTVDKLTDWDMTKFVKPECGPKIEEYLHQPDLYDNVPEIEHALWGVSALYRRGHRVVFITSDPSAGASGKIQWLYRHGFVENQNDWIIMHDKSLLRCDVLIDDGPRNIISTPARAIVFDQPWNRHLSNYSRAKNWHGVVSLIDFFHMEKSAA